MMSRQRNGAPATASLGLRLLEIMQLAKDEAAAQQRKHSKREQIIRPTKLTRPTRPAKAAARPGSTQRRPLP